jgi:hypothetical protein
MTSRAAALVATSLAFLAAPATSQAAGWDESGCR